MSDIELNELIAAWLDGRISESESELLQQRLRESAEARATFLEFSKLDAGLREVASGDLVANHDFENTASDSVGQPTPLDTSPVTNHRFVWVQLAVAASLLMVVGAVAYQLGKSDLSGSIAAGSAGVESAATTAAATTAERTIAGYATLRRVADIRWSQNHSPYREGDVLPAGVLQFDEGIAEIDFFCGATLVVEGPAKMDLESDWSVRMLAGRMRANVPPAARGFVVKAADSEIIDLGTEFALEVGPESARVKVIDGEVKLRGGEHDGNHLTTGQARRLAGTEDAEDSFSNLSTVTDVRMRHELEQRERFSQWKSYSERLQSDDRLIAYYPIAQLQDERSVPNLAHTGSQFDGAIVGSVNQTTGRVGGNSTGLDFSHPGARVRTLIDGEYQAFTFMCWVRIDSLAHVYNALFMADGYENGEPHWQIDSEGRVMFSVMVDDSAEVIYYSKVEEAVVRDAGRHRVYRTPPIWDPSKAGRWMQIAAVYDPAAMRVLQYVDGQIVSDASIRDDLLVKRLHIGASEIGNWGQPFRKTPRFAIRNLNGTIDELAIFDAALSSEEIQTMYENGKPSGY
ncbi:LamG-like jellyroll fold domain-containing protein [Novipirellula caenicola]|uniref:FecR protein domain-containing protein n=1 Tax=Novipirellula caenicola TaxID=1536901 RepID=A0ABP9VWV8_9BACT